MSTPRRHPNVVNVSEVEPTPLEKGRFSFVSRRLGIPAGGRQIGASWFEVPPGKTAFPRHYHCANEESIYVLEGSGRLKLGTEEVAVGAGDYVAFPVGPDHAHQLWNSGAGPLRYLCFSTMSTVEAVGYPDSDKIGVAAASGPGGPAAGATLWMRAVYPKDATVDYFQGEESE